MGGREKAIQEYINPKRKSLMSKAKKCLVRNTEGGCALFLPGKTYALSITEFILKKQDGCHKNVQEQISTNKQKLQDFYESTT